MTEKKYEKNQIIEIQITDLGSEGEGIGKIDGFPFFVKGAIPGDTIRASVMKVKKNLGYARLQEIEKASCDRAMPECPVYGRCGGCQLMHLKYEAQLKYKEKKVRDALHRIGGVDEDVLNRVTEPIIGMGEGVLRYRNKAQYPFGTDRDGNVVCGFYAGRTHSIISQTDCTLGHSVNREILQCVLNWMKEFGIAAYDEVNGKGMLRHVLIRRGHYSGEIMVSLVINAEELPHAEELCQSLEKIDGMHSISYSINRKNTNVIMGDNYHVIWGKATIGDEIRRNESALQFDISPLSFYQVNSIQMERLYSAALEYAGLTGKETVWDLYCGIGTISLFLAKEARIVYGVEIVPQAIEDAKENAKRNGIENVKFFTGAAEEILPKSNLPHPDVIVVDPPRKGCDYACLDTMVKAGSQRIVYVSCDPATLARDVRFLRENGYELKRVRPCDMFPNTYHVETVCLLSNTQSKKKESYITLDVEMADYYRIKNERKNSTTFSV